jgi:hypothetical protein
MTSPLDLQSSAFFGPPATFEHRGRQSPMAAAEYDLKSPSELDVPLHPANLVIQPLHFAGEFVDGLNEVLQDIVL